VLLGALTMAIAQDRQNAQDRQKSSGTTAATSTDGAAESQLADKKIPDDKKIADKKARARNAPIALPAFTEENEAAALRFVSENHRELSGLLERLKTSSPEEYKRAVRELFRTTEKLAQTKSLDRERYDIELESWKADSEIRLLAAKLTMGDSQDLRSKLRKELVRKNKLQLERLLLEKRRIDQRLKRLEESIEKAQKDQEQLADRQMAELLRNLGKEKPKKVRPSAAVSAKDKGRDRPQRAEQVNPTTP
jgi:hypothetical protein